MNVLLRLTAASTGSLALICGSFLPLAPAASPTPAPAGISAGRSFTCAVMSGGSVECWGSNQYGQLGSIRPAYARTPAPVAGIEDAIAVAAGVYHACALRSSGKVVCWGRNGFGQLGNGTRRKSATPVEVTDLNHATGISTGAFHTCAVLRSGRVKCWGNNRYAKLGNRDYNDALEPVPVKGVTRAVGVAAGHEHSCALLSDGRVTCWGCNGAGQLGDGTHRQSDQPTAVKTIRSAIQLSAGYDHTCAVLTTGSVRCWGKNNFGQLGKAPADAFLDSDDNSPPPITALRGAEAVSAGHLHTCAFLATGTVKCWGSGGFGQLGLGLDPPPDTAVPTAVVGLTNIRAVTAGDRHSCAAADDATISCWGNNSSGELGGSTSPYEVGISPVLVSGL